MSDDGFSKADVKSYVFENARMSVGSLRDRGYWANRTWPDWVNERDDDYMVPPLSRPENLIVGGGRGRRPTFRLAADLANYPLRDCACGGLTPRYCNPLDGTPIRADSASPSSTYREAHRPGQTGPALRRRHIFGTEAPGV